MGQWALPSPGGLAGVRIDKVSHCGTPGTHLPLLLSALRTPQESLVSLAPQQVPSTPLALQGTLSPSKNFRLDRAWAVVGLDVPGGAGTLPLRVGSWAGGAARAALWCGRCGRWWLVRSPLREGCRESWGTPSLPHSRTKSVAVGPDGALWGSGWGPWLRSAPPESAGQRGDAGGPQQPQQPSRPPSGGPACLQAPGLRALAQDPPTWPGGHWASSRTASCTRSSRGLARPVGFLREACAPGLKGRSGGGPQQPLHDSGPGGVTRTGSRSGGA